MSARLLALAFLAALLVALALVVVSLAVDVRPAFLDTSIDSDEAATYEFWYTLTCPSETGVECECGAGTHEQDCIATVDSDLDGIDDQAQDINDLDGDGVPDGNGVPDVIDPDWHESGPGIIESALYRMVRATERFVDEWGFDPPYWVDFDANEVLTHRPVWIYDLDGINGGAGTVRVVYNASGVLSAQPSATTPHEAWHKIQHGYYLEILPDGESNRWVRDWIHEGQARSVQSKVFENLDLSDHGAYNRLLGNPTYTILGSDGINQSMGLTGASYNAALWWTYFAEQYGDDFDFTPGEGMDAWVTYLEQFDAGLLGFDALDAAMAAESTSVLTFEDAFRDFVIANYAKELDVKRVPSSDLDGRNPATTLQYRDEGRGGDFPTPYDTPKLDVDAALAGNPQEGTVNIHVEGQDEPDADPTWAMPAWGARYYRGDVANCLAAGVQIQGDPGARLAFAFLAVQPDSNGDGVLEAERLIRSVGQDFQAAVWNGSNRFDNIALVVAGLDTTYGYDYTLACSNASLVILSPFAFNQAHVGDPEVPERFLAWVQVTGDDPLARPTLAGLDWRRDFDAFVGPVNDDNQATILDGGYVADQYWLVIQAPDKPADASGEVFDLTVRLGGVVTASQVDAVIYDELRTDRVLVIDRSGSMAGEKLVMAKAAARLFTEDLFEFDRLGVTSFAAVAHTNYPAGGGLEILPDPDADEVRTAAQVSINNLVAGGSTSIGGGLQVAQEQLTTEGSDNAWWMVLLSDGMENTAPYYNDVSDQIIGQTKVHAIALGEGAHEELMARIARETCGEGMQDVCYHHIIESDGVGRNSLAAEPLSNQLSDLYTRIAEQIAGHDRLWENVGSLGEDASIDLVIDVQETDVKDAIFSFFWDQPSGVTVQLYDPNGTLVGPGEGVVLLPDHGGGYHAVWQVEALTTGEWTAHLTAGNAPVSYRGSLSGRVPEGVQMRVFFNSRGSGTYNLNERWVGLPLPIQVNLTDRQGGIAGAVVSVTVRAPNGAIDTIDLFDDGAHGDGQSGDGVYGGVYPRVNQMGSYDLQVTASGTNHAGEAFNRYGVLSYHARNDLTMVDPDGDGLPTRWEQRFGLNPFSAVGKDGASGDPDRDLLINSKEYASGANPIIPDSDYGGEADGSEVIAGLVPFDPSDDRLGPPSEAWVTPGNEALTVQFARSPACTTLRLERSLAVEGGFALQGNYNPQTLIVHDQGLLNGTRYYYRMRCGGAGGAFSRYTAVISGIPQVDTIPPEGMILVNGGAGHVEAHEVRLEISVSSDTVQMQLSNQPGLQPGDWVPFESELDWTIDPDPANGLAYIYTYFRDAAGNISIDDGAVVRYQPPQEFAIPAGGGALASLDGHIQIQVPAGALPEAAIFRYRRLERPTDLPDGFHFAGEHFRLDALSAASRQPLESFSKPISLVLAYQDFEWQDGGIPKERDLMLFRRMPGSGWEPMIGTLQVQTNHLTMALNHLSEFLLAGRTKPLKTIFMPLIIR